MLMNSVARSPWSITAILPQGPLMVGPDQVATWRPLASNTSMQPSPLVAVVPSVLGVLPTITQPLLSMAIAVLRPTPPGQSLSFCGTWANSFVSRVEGRYCTMVVPVPCRFERLLKLSTSTSSFSIAPTETGATSTA